MHRLILLILMAVFAQLGRSPYDKCPSPGPKSHDVIICKAR